jgi:hypothetical protein
VRKYIIVSAVMAVSAIVIATVSVVAQPDGGGANHVKASLNGYQENPSIVTTGGGSLDLRIDDEAQTIEYELSFGALEGGATLFAHIHVGSRAVNGGVAVFLCGGGGKPACPNGEGSIDGVITAADVTGPASQGIEAGSFEELVQAIRAGHAYANVHTTRWGSGEIRGQIANDSQRQSEK